MARLVLGSYMVRYPLGGMMSWVLQYLTGFARLGHEIYFVEKGNYRNACYDPSRGSMSDDCSPGTRAVARLLERYGLGDRWCYVDHLGRSHGLSREKIQEVFTNADLFIDMGTHGSWLDEAAGCGLRVLIDGEPAFTQLKMQRQLAEGSQSHAYDLYYTTGRNIGTAASTAPLGGREWRHLFHPVDVVALPAAPPAANGAYTTVMNWQSYEPVTFNGTCYRHKDAEFQKFVDLPQRTLARLEVAISGSAPKEQLASCGWRIRRAQEVTHSFDAFLEYVRASRGEFSVCKSGYVVSNCGWFSDRSAAYLALGRPVVMQETGFSAHLPIGCGLFAVRNVDQAEAAIDEIESEYPKHARAARAIAEGHLDTSRVLRTFLDEIGISSPTPQLTGATR